MTVWFPLFTSVVCTLLVQVTLTLRFGTPYVVQDPQAYPENVVAGYTP